MTEVRIGKNESLDSALRRFKKQCQRSVILAEFKRHAHYATPSVRRKKKAAAARRKNRRQY
ncbi:MAG: 30S ribosomal protein S21 [Firmicutes bacterium]|nr:30S ribosomal protein S21 [Bacillota bacterium]